MFLKEYILLQKNIKLHNEAKYVNIEKQYQEDLKSLKKEHLSHGILK